MEEQTGDLASRWVGSGLDRGALGRCKLCASSATEPNVDVPQGGSTGASGLHVPFHQNNSWRRSFARQDQVLQLDAADVAVVPNFQHDSRLGSIRKLGAVGGELGPGLTDDLGIFRDRHGILQEVRSGVYENNLAAVSVRIEGSLYGSSVVRCAVAFRALVFEVDEVPGRLVRVLISLPLKVGRHLKPRDG